MKKAIIINDINHSFNDKKVLENIDINIGEGEIFGLLGPSGAGKTTLINILTGQLKSSSGKCTIYGINSTNMSGEDYKKIGVMMDNFGLKE